MGRRLKMSIFEDIKMGLIQAIALEKAKKELRSHLEQSRGDLENGRLQPADHVFTDVLRELEIQEKTN